MHYDSCPPAIRRYVDGFAELLAELLGPGLAGVYLHGSLAMGCCTPPGSDIDVLAVVDAPLSSAMRAALGRAVPAYADRRPGIGCIEFSIITRDAAQNIPNPMPYEFHYSEMWHERLLRGEVDDSQPRFDPDLFAHLTCVRQRGICLRGADIGSVFGEVPRALYMAAVLEDLAWILGGQLATQPVYGVLNICRVLQLLMERTSAVYSKAEGGEWGLAHLPERFAPLIRQALAVYAGETAAGWDRTVLLAFGAYAKEQVNQLTQASDED